MFAKRQTPSSPLFYSLNILKIENLCKFEIAKFIFKLKNIPDFNYMHNLKPINQIHKYNTRLSKNNYFLQRKKTETGKKSLEYIGSTIWLDLPSDIKLYSFPKFKQQFVAINWTAQIFSHEIQL